MAKGKRAAALFEVIHSGREHKPLKVGSSGWWFKKPSQNESFSAASLANAADEDSGESLDDPTVGRDPEEITSAAAVPARIEQSAITHVAPAPARPGVDVAVDSEHQQITFKFTYASAIVAGFAIVVAVMLAYLVGQKMSRGPSLAVASQTTDELRAKPANPAVLDVPQRKTPPQAQQPDAPTREPDFGTSSKTGDSDHVASAEVANAMQQPTQRTVNLNYVVIQSYPEEKQAKEARDALLKAGIGCTIEQGLRGLRSDWFTVVGTQGFQRQSSEECKAYIQRIDQISQQFAQGKRSFKAFTPLPYKWDKQ